MNLDSETMNRIIENGRLVLVAEGQAVLQMADEMPADFAAAVALILNVKGRVIVSGIGKSGHIGRKISATLASTGTPSYFVHCAEASHGDLGMITADDICLLLSNSGETSELRDIVAHTQRFSIPMIAISSKPDSTLMKAADCRLTLANAKEACAIGMAPTTSTTLTLAIGDALAVALMKERGFAPENFQVFHPGGKLGAQMATVEQLMHGQGDVPLVDKQDSMSETLLTMTSKGFGIAGVMDGKRLIGVISDGDLRRNMENLMSCKAEEVASQNPITVSPDSRAIEALAIMNDKEIGAMMVVSSDGTPIGILHIHDCLRAGMV